MINSFRELITVNDKEFNKKLDDDIKKAKDGTIFYAFISRYSEGHPLSLYKYTKLKILKETDSGIFLGFLSIYTDEDVFGEPIVKIMPKNMFNNVRGKVNESDIVGYCLDKIDADAVYLLYVKNSIDKFCSQFGYDTVQEFNNVFTDFKIHHAEKFV